MMRAAIVALALVASSAAARAETADEAPPEARRLVARAQVHYDLGEYDRAIAAYREAYRLHPSPGLLYNLGQAYRLAGDCVAATTMYRNYLRLAPHSPYRRLVKQHLSALAECHRRRSGGEVAGGGLIAASTHGGRIASLGVGPFPYRMSDDDAAPSPRDPKKQASYVLAGASLVFAGMAAYYAIEADEAADEVAALYDDGEPWRRIAEADARGQRAERYGFAFAIASGVALASSATLYVLGRREDEERRAALMVAPQPKGASVSVSWGF